MSITRTGPAFGMPVWLLDVDGVLNAARPGWDVSPDQARAVVDGVSYRLRWAQPMVDRVRAMATGGAVEVRWATTWVDHIAQIEASLGLPRLPTAFSGLGSHLAKAATQKLDAALHTVEVERRPLIWTDDDAIPEHGPMLDRLRRAGVPVLLLSPRTGIGLQPEDLDDIDAFLDELAVRVG